MLRFSVIVAATVLCTPAFAVTCKSVNAKLDGTAVSASMKLTMRGTTLTSRGVMNGVAGPARQMRCSSVKDGVFCTHEFANYTVQIVTTGNRLVQTFSDASTGDAGSLVFRCDRSVKMKP